MNISPTLLLQSFSSTPAAHFVCHAGRLWSKDMFAFYVSEAAEILRELISMNQVRHQAMFRRGGGGGGVYWECHQL